MKLLTRERRRVPHAFRRKAWAFSLNGSKKRRFTMRPLTQQLGHPSFVLSFPCSSRPVPTVCVGTDVRHSGPVPTLCVETDLRIFVTTGATLIRQGTASAVPPCAPIRCSSRRAQPHRFQPEMLRATEEFCGRALSARLKSCPDAIPHVTPGRLSR